MANSIKTDYMNAPSLGYSEYFIKNETDLNALSPLPGDRAIVADNGAIYICIDKGTWNKFGNSVPGGEVVIASDINEDSTNDEVAGAKAVWDIVYAKTDGVEKVINKTSTINENSTHVQYPDAAATYAYGQQVKEEAINAFSGSYLSTSGGNLSGPVNSASYYSIQNRRDFDFTDTTIYNSDTLTRITGIINGTITPTSSDLDYYDLDLNGKIDSEDYQLLDWAINGKIRGEELSETTWKSAYMIRKIIFGADPSRTYSGNEKIWARVIGTYGTIRWMFSDETTYIDDAEHRKAYPYIDVLTLNNVAGGGAQSDWEQIDDTAADYIKNRPFYEEEITSKALTLEASDWEMVQQSGQTYYQYIGTGKLNLVVGMIVHCTVVLGGYSIPGDYTITVLSEDPYIIGYQDSNMIIMDGYNGTETGDYFYMKSPLLYDEFIANSASQNVTHQIPQKFIPPMVNYSTTEHEIGTWVDGSKLYEKTYIATITSSSDLEYTITIANTEIDTCVGIDCSLIDNNKQTMGQGVYYSDGDITASICAFYVPQSPTTDEIYVEIVNNDIFYYPLQAYVTIRYTKTS